MLACRRVIMSNTSDITRKRSKGGAMEANWWIINSGNSRIRKALQKALAKEYVRAVKPLMAAAKAKCANGDGATWRNLATALGLSGNDELYRRRTGERKFTTAELLATAIVYETNADAFLPDACAWISVAFADLTNRKPSDNDVNIYVEYCMQRLKNPAQLRVKNDGCTDEESARVIADQFASSHPTLELILQSVTQSEELLTKITRGES